MIVASNVSILLSTEVENDWVNVFKFVIEVCNEPVSLSVIQLPLTLSIAFNLFTKDDVDCDAVNVFKFEYQFAITGQRKMISVGEYYDYLDVLVEIIDADEHSIKLLAVFSLLKNNVNNDYILKTRLDNDLSEELSYFFNESYVRVMIVKIQFSEELKNKIDDVLTEIQK